MRLQLRLGISLLLLGLLQSGLLAAQQPAPADLASHSHGAWGVDLTDRDSTVRPGDNFYKSENGAWLARTELSGQLSFAAYWADLRRLAPRRVAALLRDAAADLSAAPGSPAGKAGAFFRSFMDPETLERRGLTPLEPALDAIRSATTRERLAELMGRAAGPGTQQMLKFLGPISAQSPFQVAIGQDQRRPDRYAVFLGQGGLGLPGPEYYSDPQFAHTLGAYQAYIAQLLGLLQWPDAEGMAREVVALEGRIAAVSGGPDILRDPVKSDNPMTISALMTLAPDFDWRAFLRGAGLGKTTRLVIDAPMAIPAIARIVAATPVAVLQARQAFTLLDDAAPTLSAAAVSANFDFRWREFNNRNAVPPTRERLAFNTIEASIGKLVGVLYVQRYFSPAARAEALAMAANLRRAFDARLARLSWMTPATRTAARQKLSRMTINLGYPDHLPDYATLQIRDDDLYGNVSRATAFEWQRQVRRLGSHFDRGEWFFTPQSVNYSYQPSSNTLEIPSASFEPPFFDLAADPAVNYGAIGALLGSQMVAAFDGVGRHYDANGRLHEWWTPEESRAFEEMSRAIAEQYSAVEPLPGVHFKGELLANEAIDDLGGMLIALDAYHLSLGGKVSPVLDGFTGVQRFFLGRAQMWRGKFLPEFVRNQVAIGVNAQPFQRVNGPVRNMDAWYDAFGVGADASMYLPPDRRLRIW